MAIDIVGIGRRIKDFRNNAGYSQEELGNIVFVSSTYISYIETGVKAPSLELLIMIANVLDVSADDLLIDNLTHTSSPVGRELHALLQDCNRDEREMLMRLLKFMKELFSEFSI